MKKYLLYTIISFSFISCAGHVPLLNNEKIRDPANDESCLETASHIISSEEDESIDLVTILQNRKLLKEKYQQVGESIRDFKLYPDMPIEGRTKLILDPIEGYLAKIMMIRNAKQTIDLSYYIFKDEESASALLHELRMAVKRKVKVRILIDSFGSLSESPFYNDIKALVALRGKELLDRNGHPTGERASPEAVLFNPVFNIRAHVANWFRKIHNLMASEDKKLPIGTFTINGRLHDKILLVDSFLPNDSIAIIGGRNMEDVNYGIIENEIPTNVDAEVMIKGFSQKKESAIQNILEDHYNKIYFYLANKNFNDFLFKTNKKTARDEFKKARAASGKLFINDNAILKNSLREMEKEDFLNSNFEESLISILDEIQNLSRTEVNGSTHNLFGKKNGNSLLAKILNQVKKAKKTIVFISPYFWIPDEEVNILVDWAAADPSRKIKFFTNSILTSNKLVAQAMVDHTIENNIIKKIKGTDVEKQFEIYSYGLVDDVKLGGNKKYGLLHTKAVIIDDINIILSTSNLDPISRYNNSEVGVMIDNLRPDSKNIINMKNYIINLEKKSTIWGGVEWNEIKNHPHNMFANLLELLVTKILVGLNLVPLL